MRLVEVGHVRLAVHTLTVVAQSAPVAVNPSNDQTSTPTSASKS